MPYIETTRDGGTTQNAAGDGNSHARPLVSELSDGPGGECELVAMRCAQCYQSA